MTARHWSILCVAVVAAACGRSESGHPSATPPAKVTSAVTEATLTTVTLTPEAEGRLGIETAAVEERGVMRTRSISGEVIPAGGAQTTVTAPLAGTLEAPGGVVPPIGSSVTKGQVVFRLVPLAPAERDVRIEAERAVGEANGRQIMAAKRAQRAAQLAADGAGSRRAAEEADADLAVANAALKAAQDRLVLASRGISASGSLSLGAPFDALLRAVHAGPGQTVAAGAPLFDLVGLDTLWIRVPIYAGDVDTVERSAPARVVPLGAAGTVAGDIARPISAPPSADASTAGVDLYYSIGNKDRTLRPGQRVGVRVTLTASARSLVVPRGTVLHDAYGGTWVYEARGGRVFARRRVSVVDLVGDLAVLDHGPPPGTRVVTTGAAELFGTEFGSGK